MSTAVAGDPSGCSQLGAELRSRAATLLALHTEVVEQQRGSGRSRRRDHLDPLLVERDRATLEAVAVRLDAAGAALQRYAQELAAMGQEAQRIERAARAAGLELDGLRVVEPWGVAAPDTARARLEAMPDLQRRSERLASQVARARGSLRRSLEGGRDELERTAAGVRGSLG
ncbi:hypothetical protein V3N99_04365 [Dermatophilaceae bacterium Soc4.6]